MPDFTAEQTEAGVVAALAAMASDVQLTAIEGVPFLAVPEGVTLTNYADLLPTPKRLKAAQTFEDAASFSQYVNTFKQSETMLVAQRLQGTVTAHLDYHGKGSPSWSEHTATLKVKTHEDFAAWSALANGVSQVAFGEFIEDHIHNIAKPDAAILQEMVLKFQAMKETTFKSTVNLTNGDTQLVFIEDSERGTEGRQAFPSMLFLVLPVFEGHDPIECQARIRYRIKEQKLSFQVEIVKKSELVRQAFREVLDVVTGETGLTVLMGA